MDENVRNYYNEHVKEEDKRLSHHAFELPMTLHFIEKYLRPGAKILDISCGTGHYAKELLSKGYQLGLNDISDANIELTKERLEGKSGILGIDRNHALESILWNKEDWDAILLLGPLYHMPKIEDRIKLLEMASANVSPGGFVFSGYMNRSQAMVYGLKNNPEGILNAEGARELWDRGTDNTFIEGTEYFNHAYFSKPEEINAEIEKAQLTPIHLLGYEGIFGERFELYHKLDKKLQEAWYNFALSHCEEKSMIYCSKHILSIAKKES